MDRRILILNRKVIDNLRQPWSVSTMAKVVHLSDSHLRKLFQIEIGKSPARFVREIRLKAVCSLLEEGILPIKEIAREVGFRDQSILTRNFTKRYGISPSAYRKNYWSKIENDLSRD